jgi:diguanylate cyclase (GGDEF)-like protein
MSLRAKLFLPLLIFSLLFAAYAQAYWLPRFIQLLDEKDRAHITAHLNSVAAGLVPLLLEHQLATAYENLDTVLQENRDWIRIELYDPKGRQLYPFEPQSTATSSQHQRVVQQPITYLDNVLGRLVLTVDTTGHLEAVQSIQRHFHIALVALLLIFGLAIGLILEWVVRRPVLQLSRASNKLAHGDFDVALPRHNSDEVGKLMSSFAAMRDAIQRYQADLRSEVNSHKDTAEQLYQEKERFSYHASHDPLTGLINRREFELRVAAAGGRARQDKSEHALFYMDLDQFKVVNDTCGHIAGDELLRQLGTLLHHTVREGDTLARLGGDEFGVLLEYCPIDKALIIANELRETVQSFRFHWQDKVFTVGVSIGVAPITADSDDLPSILSAADAACYAAKDRGRNRVHIYEVDDAELARRHGEMQWVSRLNRALEENRFVLYCQPIVPIARDTGKPTHFEVLLRMRDDNQTLITPDAFVRAAERYNLMGTIDRWVVRNTFARLSGCLRHSASARCPTFSINLSGASLNDEEFLAFISDQFRTRQVPPSSICFEITETAAIANLVHAESFIKPLKNLGCRFALDDFGSGLSSFAYLKHLPVDYLKIDGAFVREIAQDPIDFAMVKSINEIGRVMGMQTVAEFVETKEIFAKLGEIQVDFGQGCYIGSPFPLDQLMRENQMGLSVSKRY